MTEAKYDVEQTYKSKPPITRDEYNDLVNGYESRIDQLNVVLDEIQDMLSPGSSDRIDPDWIQEVLDKRGPVQ